MKQIKDLLKTKMTPELRKAWNKYLIENKKLLYNRPQKDLIKCVAVWLYQQNGNTDIYLAQDKTIEFMIRNNI